MEIDNVHIHSQVKIIFRIVSFFLTLVTLSSVCRLVFLTLVTLSGFCRLVYALVGGGDCLSCSRMDLIRDTSLVCPGALALKSQCLDTLSHSEPGSIWFIPPTSATKSDSASRLVDLVCSSWVS